MCVTLFLFDVQEREKSGWLENCERAVQLFSPYILLTKCIHTTLACNSDCVLQFIMLNLLLLFHSARQQQIDYPRP